MAGPVGHAPCIFFIRFCYNGKMPGRIWIVSLLVLGFSFCSLQKPPRTLPAKAQPLETPAAEIYQTGEASWYGEDFHGKTTANGEVYDMNKLTAAHQRLPFDTLVDVENVENGRTVRVRINDRGPFLKNRIIDLSFKAAQRLGMADQGTARVCLRVVRMGQGPAIPAVEGGGGVWLQAGAFGEYGNARELAERVAGAAAGSPGVDSGREPPVQGGGRRFFQRGQGGRGAEQPDRQRDPDLYPPREALTRVCGVGNFFYLPRYCFFYTINEIQSWKRRR